MRVLNNKWILEREKNTLIVKKTSSQALADPEILTSGATLHII